MLAEKTIGADTLEILSLLFGWSYFVIWIVSSWPQPILNFRRKHVGGLSIDYVVINVVGYVSYAIYNIAFLMNEDVKEEYRRRHDGHPNIVEPNDVAYSLHATLCSMIVFFQVFYYPRSPGQRLSLFNVLTLALYAIICALKTIQVFIFKTEHLIDLFYLMSYCKVYVTTAKYIHQLNENYTRKSTVGWSILPVYMDFIGGVLSIAQMFVDAARTDDWSALLGNFAKLGLALVSLFFDGLFYYQHHILYPDRTDTDVGRTNGKGTPRATEAGEESALLGQPTDTQ